MQLTGNSPGLAPALTNLDVMARILAEATGRPESVFRKSIRRAVAAGVIRTDHKLDDPAEPGALERLRKNLPGVRLWLANGGRKATGHRGHRMG